MKMLFALVAAMAGFSGFCAAEWTLTGDWELLVKEGGGRLSCRVVTEGEITTLDPGKGFFGTGFVFRKADGDMNGLFNYMAENGYRHHVAFAYGKNSDAVREALVKYLGYEIDVL